MVNDNLFFVIYKGKGKAHLYSVAFSHTSPSVALFSQTETTFKLRPAAQACAHRLWPMQLLQPSAVIEGRHLCGPCQYKDYYSFTDHRGMEGRVGLVG